MSILLDSHSQTLKTVIQQILQTRIRLIMLLIIYLQNNVYLGVSEEVIDKKPLNTKKYGERSGTVRYNISRSRAVV